VTGAELAAALERCEAPAGGFHHVDHLRVAWCYLEQAPGVEAALARMAATLRRFAVSVGQADKYSDAITAFWIYQVAAARAVMPDAVFDDVVRAFPRLLDKDLSHAAPPGAGDSPRDASHRPVPGQSR
jgi:hypothetical protein